MSNDAGMKETIAILTVSPWDEPKRLRRQLAEVLSADYNVIYITLPYRWKRPLCDDEWRDGEIRIINIAGPWIPFRILDRIKLFRRIFEIYLAWKLNKLIKKIEIKTIFCFTSSYPILLKRIKAIPLIYIANDDFVSMAKNSFLKKDILKKEADTIELCKCIVSVSETIARKLAIHGKPVQVIYPGHDCLPLALESLKNQKKINKSACFYGYIDWRIDFNLLEKMLDTGWFVRLIGPILGVIQDIERLRKSYPTSFQVQSAIPANQALDTLSLHSILILPYLYKNKEQAEAIELPNKIFVYFSALRPIVATWMPNLKFTQSGLIYQGKTSEDFISQCNKAYQEDSIEHASVRLKIANENKWDARSEVLRQLINNHVDTDNLKSI